MTAKHSAKWMSLVLVAFLVSCGSSSGSTTEEGGDGTTTGGSTEGGETGEGTGQTEAGTGGETPPPAVTPPLPPMPQGVTGPPTPWAQMAGRDRGRYMAEHVVPTMTTLLQAYDAEHFADVTCATCHGAHARETHFHMPTPDLPVLPAWGTPAWTQMQGEHPRMMAFMAERMKPVMAQLLGVPEMTAENQSGFSCMSCHTTAAPAPGTP